MSKIAKNLMASLAATGLLLAPVAAHANTRAGDNSSFYTSAQVQPGVGRSAEGEDLGGSGDIIGILLAGLWLTGIIVIVVNSDDDGNDNQSPGAN